MNELAELRHRIAELETAEAERQKMQERLEHLNLVLRAIQNVNQLITREKDRDRLLKGVCSTLTETRGYYNAWTALLDENGRLLTHAEAGLGKDFLPMVERLKKGELTRCGQKALARAGVVVTEDPVSACDDCPLSQKYGGRGAMTARLEHGGKVYGLISASIPAEFASDREEQALLDEVAADIASALHNIELEKERGKAEEALRESEERLRLMFGSIAEGITVTDLEGNITEMNDAVLRIHGYDSKGELMGRSAFELIAESDHARAMENLKKTLEQGYSRTLEYTLLRKDGSEFSGRLSATLITGASGESTAFVAVTEDITERKKAEQEARYQREYFKSLFDGAPEAVVSVDMQRRATDVNPAFEKLFGYALEDIKDKDMHTFILPQGKQREGGDIFRRASQGEIVAKETVRKAADGREIPVSFLGAPVIVEGKQIGTLGIYRDISERKQAEERLRESEARYRNIVELAPDSILTADASGIITSCNRAFVEQTGFGHEDIVGKHFAELPTHPNPEDTSVYSELFASTVAGEKAKSFEFLWSRKDGTLRWGEVRAAVMTAGGEFQGAQVIMRDITERKRAQEELESSRDELRRLATQLELVREEERAAIAWELHDEVGQALAALQIDLHWLEQRLSRDDTELLEKAQSMSHLIQSNTERLRRLYMELRPGMLDDLGLAPTIEWQAEEFQKRTGIKSVVSLDRDAAPRDADYSLAVYRVFQEALSNVTRHAEATEVNISLTKADNRMVLEITDNGRGITKKQASAPGSSGLVGMRERLRPWGGKVKITGVRGKGTTVRVSIPAGKEKQA